MGIRAYLDIETSFEGEITIVGIYREDSGTKQFIGRNISAEAILESIEGASVLYTFNGSRFDLPRIRSALGLDLRSHVECRDLLLDCWNLKLMGGLKKVEKELGIERKTQGIDGFDAMKLWARYVDLDDNEALDVLLLYNREDIENLAVLRERLSSLTLKEL